MGKKFLMSILVIIICAAGHAGDVAAADAGPLDQVKSSINEIITILKDEKYVDENLYDDRRALILQTISKRFNFRLMAKLSLGRVWEEITVEEQNHFDRLFSDLLKNTYIRRIEAYSNEEVIYQKEAVKDDLAVVYCMFVKNNEGLSIIYKLRNEDGRQWLVYDVIIEGASLVKQYRRQFTQIIREESFSGLILRLEQKVKDANANRT